MSRSSISTISGLSSPSGGEDSALATVTGVVARKAALKEKVVQMYDVVLRAELEDVDEDRFWSEFFLLRPKIAVLESELAKYPNEHLLTHSHVHRLFDKCLDSLGEDRQMIRVVYALQTLCGLLRALTKKRLSGRDLVLALNASEPRMTKLVAHLTDFLTGDEPSSLKDLCLKLLLVVASGYEDVSKNALLDYLMTNSVFESLVHLLSRAESRALHGHSAVLLITVLVQYRKYESDNPYIVKLSILDQELALHGYGQVITSSLVSYVQNQESALGEQPSGNSSSWLSSFTSMVGNMFVSEEGSPRIEQMKARNAVLLALYEAVHLNRNFIATLGRYSDVDIVAWAVKAKKTFNEIFYACGKSKSRPTTPPTPSSPERPSSPPSILLAHYQTETTNNLNKSASSASVSSTTANGTEAASMSSSNVNSSGAPSNLLVAFLEYCSIVMQDTKTESSLSTVKLSFLILMCVTEDQYANALMHDPNLVFRVRLRRTPMRHRKPNGQAAESNSSTSRSLACAVMDLMVEFVRSHMMKRLPFELYLQSLAVIHRLLAYQKRSRVRLGYPWKDLWTSLIALLKFITANESSLIKKMNVFAVARQVVVIFNLFVTYGDTFLPSPGAYDELYYELVRCHGTFDSLYSMALRYSTGGGEFKESAVKLTNSLVNIRAITAHFNPKIDAWLASQQLSTPTEEQILEVVKSNYDSLTLKLQDGLDQYEQYSEAPHHTEFFNTVVRNVISDTRQHVVLNDLELQTVLQDFSSIQ